MLLSTDTFMFGDRVHPRPEPQTEIDILKECILRWFEIEDLVYTQEKDGAERPPYKQGWNDATMRYIQHMIEVTDKLGIEIFDDRVEVKERKQWTTK